jgi:branched-subunit amino acid transport protein
MTDGGDLYALAVIVGMTIITVVTRSFFFLSRRPWALPRWAERGLQYAPVAALAAVIAPEILLTDGHLLATWRDARIFGALAGIAWYHWRRGVLGTIVVGMAVYLPLHVGLGW